MLICNHPHGPALAGKPCHGAYEVGAVGAVALPGVLEGGRRSVDAVGEHAGIAQVARVGRAHLQRGKDRDVAPQLVRRRPDRVGHRARQRHVAALAQLFQQGQLDAGVADHLP